MADPTAKTKCEHKRMRLIAKDNEAQYVECLDCGEILEAGEIKEATAPAPPQKPAAGSATAGFDESLSDA